MNPPRTTTRASILAVLLLLGPVLTAPAGAQVRARAYIPLRWAGELAVIDPQTHTAVGPNIPIGLHPNSVVATPDGRTVYVVINAWDHVAIVDASTNTHGGGSIAVADDPIDIDITPDGRKLYVASGDGHAVTVIDTANNTVLRTIPIGDRATGVAVSPDGQRVWVARRNTSTVAVINTASDEVVGSPFATADTLGTYQLAFTPNGQRLYVTNDVGNKVTAIDPATGQIVASIPLPALSSPTDLVVTPDGSTVLVTLWNAEAVAAINVATNTAGPTVQVGVDPIGIAILPDRQQAYVVNAATNSLTVLDLDPLAATATINPGIAPGSRPFTSSQFIGPNILTNCGGNCGPLVVSSDNELTTLGFGRFLNIDSGVLRPTGVWQTNRVLSLLAGGGTIDVPDGSNLVVFGDTINAGTLVKRGAGSLWLRGGSRHLGGTTVLEGTLTVHGVHSGPVRLEGGSLTGDGAVGSIHATGGVLGPSYGTGEVLNVPTATLTSGVVLIFTLSGPNLGTQYGQLAADAITLGNATLQLAPLYTPTPGQAFTIITNATGTFAGRPEGATFTVGSTRFRITYQGGDGNDVVVTVDGPPTLTALPNQQIVVGATLGPLAFTVGDPATPVSSLIVTATSSNQALLPSAGIAIGGSGASRTLTATPVVGASGTTVITVSVTDGTSTMQQSFTLTVIPAPLYYLSEGATGGFFTTDLLLANPSASPAPVVITFFKENGETIVQNRTLPATSRTTVRVNDVAGLEASAFSTSVLSTDGLPLVVERTMWWDASGYGAHTEKASAAASSRWYFAEGAQGWFHTYFLLLNPNATATVAHVTYFVEGGAAVQRDYPMAARTRLTIDAGADSALVNRAFGALVEFDLPGMAERAMYFGDTPQFSGGHASAGVTAPSTTWFLAEGATGPYFDTFLLITNPGVDPASVTVTYLRDQGAPIVQTRTLAGHERLTLNIAEADPVLVNAAVSMRVESDRPVVAERSQYWPRGAWHDAHNSAGETTAGTRWGFAEGRVGGASHAQTYLLVANPGAQPAGITATFLRSDGTTIVKTFTVQAASRFNIAVTGAGGHVPELVDESFGAVIASTEPVIVERSLYADSGAVSWAAGTNATGTRLP